MPNGKISFAKNLLIIVLGSIATKLVSFLFVPLYTAILSTEEYGSVDVVFTTVSLLLPLFTGVIFEAVLRFALDNAEDKKQVFSIGIYTDLIGIILFLVLSPLCLFLEPLRDNYVFFLIYFVATVINDTMLYFARGLNEIKKHTIVSVTQTILLCLLNIVFLVWIKLGITGYFLTHIISLLFSSTMICIMVRADKFVLLPKEIDKGVIKRMLSYSLPMIPNTVSWWINTSSDRFFIITICSISTNGIYSIASKIPSIISLGSALFNTAWQISAVDSYNTDNGKKRFGEMCFNYYSVVFLLGAIVICFTKPLSAVLFNKDFFNAWVYVPLLVLASCIHAQSNYLGSIFTTIKKTKYLSYTTLIGAIANIIMNYIFIIQWGAMGAAIATMLSYFIVYYLRFAIVQHIYPITIKRINDTICTVLLIIECIIICLDRWKPMILSLPIILIICILRFPTIKAILKIVYSIFHKSN